MLPCTAVCTLMMCRCHQRHNSTLRWINQGWNALVINVTTRYVAYVRYGVVRRHSALHG